MIKKNTVNRIIVKEKVNTRLFVFVHSLRFTVGKNLGLRCNYEFFICRLRSLGKIAKGSVAELRIQVYISGEVGIFSDRDVKELIQELKAISKMLQEF